MKILIVEDDTVLAAAVRACLTQARYSVDHVADGDQALRRMTLNHSGYDLFILDVELPTLSGFDICKRIREGRIKTPILMLTGRDAVDDKVLALGFGADDYMTKPFAQEELVARVQALLRRPRETVEHTLVAGDLVLDTVERKVYKTGKEIMLSHKEFGILEYFMRHPNQVIERDRLLDHVWDFEFASLSNVVDVHLHRLRHKIDLCSLETIRGVGYRLNA